LSSDDIVVRDTRFPVTGDVRVIKDEQDYAELVVIDISRSGIGIDGLIHFTPDTPVRVEFPGGETRTGRTRWRDTFTSGIAFDVPMMADELNQLRAALATQPHFAGKAGPSSPV